MMAIVTVMLVIVTPVCSIYICIYLSYKERALRQQEITFAIAMVAILSV